MSDITNVMSLVLSEVTDLSGGTLVHGGNTYMVCKAFTSGETRGLLPAGFEADVADLVVLMFAGDVKTPAPQAKDLAILDGESYVIGAEIQKNAVYWQIPLRKAT
jgi:hypothetical protein